jgi:hypothetical protein
VWNAAHATLQSIGHVLDQQARETDNQFTKLTVLSPQSIDIRSVRIRFVFGNAAVFVRTLYDALRHGRPPSVRGCHNDSTPIRRRPAVNTDTLAQIDAEIVCSGKSNPKMVCDERKESLQQKH